MMDNFPKPERPKNLTEYLRQTRLFLESVFGLEFLRKELDKLRWKPRGKPEEYKYLSEVQVHEAAKWWALLHNIEESAGRISLRFSTDVERFMHALLFYYTLQLLIKSSTVNLKDHAVMGKVEGPKEVP